MGAILRAEEIELETVRLPVISRTDLLHDKLRSASDPARRRSKRLQDLIGYVVNSTLSDQNTCVGSCG